MIQQQIFALQDKPYGEFQSRLVPTIAKERIIGVRIPVMRKLAKQLTKEEPEAVQAFLIHLSIKVLVQYLLENLYTWHRLGK